MAQNERNTENLVRDALRELGYYDDPQIVVEEQKSSVPKIDKLLKNASKTAKGGGAGYPEFLIRSEKYPELMIVIECKAQNKFHESESRNLYADYAVDGALLYASFLAKEYDVIAIGVSGETKEEMRISHYLNLKGQDEVHEMDWEVFHSLERYHSSYIKSDIKFKQDYDALLAYSRKLNDKFQSKKIKEAHRSLLISAVLIALENKAFNKSYKEIESAKDLAASLIISVKSNLEKSDIPTEKIDIIMHAYSFISVTSSLTGDKEFVLELIDEIDKNINGFIQTHKYFDVLGQFYIEFLRYANADKGLGIVLTPPHITKLFVKLAEIDKDSVVLDNCCGTGGFLISAMREMIEDAKEDQQKIEEIKKKQLVGVEFQEDIYALAASNMILHKDGKSNIIQGDCFNKVDLVKDNYKPNVALLNPPYKNKNQSTDPEELAFALNALDMLEKGGKCVIILPMGCALAQTGTRLELKRKLLERHTLDAVLSMPDELFYNSKASVVTCVMIFTAKKPHPKDKKTWFGYWKDDGFTKVKHQGRVDLFKQWNQIEQNWLSAFRNLDDIPGHSVKQIVTHKNEWCAEAYMETDYTSLSKKQFKAKLHEFSVFLFKYNYLDEVTSQPLSTQVELPPFDQWKCYKYKDIFHVMKGFYNKKPFGGSAGEIPFIGATEYNNGITAFYTEDEIDGASKTGEGKNHILEKKIFAKNTITISNNGSVGYAFYQPAAYTCSHDVNPIALKNHKLNKYIAIFLCSIIELERFRWAYGRKWRPARMPDSEIWLPSKGLEPDWAIMEQYIKGLPYSHNLDQLKI